MKKSQHFGYYPEEKEDISEDEAQLCLHDKIVENLEAISEMKILDAGCGQGFVACDLAKRYGLNITGVDITPYIIESARKRVIEFGVEGQVSFQVMDYTNLDFPDNSFDRIYTVETLCHAPDLEKTLSEFYRVLKPGGKIVFVEYGFKDLSEFSEYEKKMFELIAEGTYSPSLYLFCYPVFTDMLSIFGFQSVARKNISVNFVKSIYRLYRLARYPYKIIKFLNLRRWFVNTTIGVEFYRLAKKRLWEYNIYTASKH